MASVLVPIPDRDFDPSEVAVTWRVLSDAGHALTFATASGAPGEADDIMVTGRGLDPWSRLPRLGRLTLLGAVLRANADARAAYGAMQRAQEFMTPKRWTELRASDFDALFLGGGHRARGMRQYLESEVLRELVVAFFRGDKPVAAICHGVLLAARSIDPATGRSVLYGRRTTALTWQQERTAWTLARIGRFWDPDYYRTYRETQDQPDGHMSVESEVTRALAAPDDFKDVPRDDPQFGRKTRGIARDTVSDDSPAFIVRDGNYLSGRWPGDAHTLARAFDALLRARE